jgi:RNA polymerase sigma-70 factor (ECF subfamily)
MDAAAVEKVAWHRSSIGSKPFPGPPHPSDMLDTTMPAPPAANDAVDEPALVRAAAAGDTAAYELLYRRHAPRVFAVLWRLCGGQQARAEDALQEAFLQAWKALPGFRFESSLSTWLHRLGVNAALMELRGRAAGQDHDSLEDVDGGLQELAVHDRCAGTERDLERALRHCRHGRVRYWCCTTSRLETPGNRRAAADGRRQFQGTVASCARPVARTAGRHDMSTHEHDSDHDLLARLRALPNERDVPADGWARLSAQLPPREPQAAPAPTATWWPCRGVRGGAGGCRSALPWRPAWRSTRWRRGAMRSRTRRCRPPCSCRRRR